MHNYVSGTGQWFSDCLCPEDYTATIGLNLFDNYSGMLFIRWRVLAERVRRRLTGSLKE